MISNSPFRKQRAAVDDEDGRMAMSRKNEARRKLYRLLSVCTNSICCTRNPLEVLTISRPYELGLLVSTIRTCHFSESSRVARMPDHSFNHVSVVGHGIVILFFTKKCIHMSLASVKNSFQTLPMHLHTPMKNHTVRP